MKYLENRLNDEDVASISDFGKEEEFPFEGYDPIEVHTEDYGKGRNLYDIYRKINYN